MADTPLDPGVPVLAEAALADRVERSSPVIVLFYADWCPFCEAFLPVFRKRVDAAPVDAVAANISHPEDPRWEAYDVDSIPTLTVHRAGEEIARLPARKGEGLDGSDLDAFLDELREDPP